MSTQFQVNIELGGKKEQVPGCFGEDKILPLPTIDLHFLGRPYASIITIRTKLHQYNLRRYECMNGTYESKLGLYLFEAVHKMSHAA